jgi:nucleotide-binding universal stress UspA family protein
MSARGREALVFVDPSPRGDWAQALAALLPARERWSFHLLATEDARQHDPGLLDRAAERLRGARALRPVVRPGPPRRAIVAEADDRPYDLVVLPPAGRNALQRMLRGSRVATVVRGVHAPVLVARYPPARIARILAAVSGGSATEAVVAWAADLAAGFPAHVDYLHVASEVALPFAPHAESGARVPPPPDALGSAEEALSRARSSGALVVREGLVVDEVLDAFESGSYDLLVVGSSPELGHERVGRERISERIVLGCPGSVLVTPAEVSPPPAGGWTRRST